MWHKFIETALLGTEKKPFKTAELPPMLIPTPSDPEQEFLDALGLCFFYLETGKLPNKLSRTPDMVTVEETFEVAPEPVLNIFDLLDKVIPQVKEKLFNQWLDLLICRQYIVSPEMVVNLLIAGNNFSMATKTKIRSVVGRKGNWVLELNPDFRYGNAQKINISWDEGNTADRKALLQSYLINEPATAFNNLRMTWSEEPLTTKRMFLEVLRVNLVPETLDFVEELYNNEFAWQSKEKKTAKECRNIIVSILLHFSESKLYQTTVLQILSLLKINRKKGILGLMSKEYFEFQLPETPGSDFWIAQDMERIYGLEASQFDISEFNTLTQSWLAFFLEYLPAEVWINHFSSYADFVSYFLNNETFLIKVGNDMHHMYSGAITRNAIQFDNKQLAHAVIVNAPVLHSTALLRHIEPEVYELYVKNNRYFADAGILACGPYNLSGSWSLQFTEYIMRNITDKLLKSQATDLNTLGAIIAQFAHPDIYNKLQKYRDEASVSNLFDYWSKNLYEPLNAVLHIRILIKSTNTQ